MSNSCYLVVFETFHFKMRLSGRFISGKRMTELEVWLLLRFSLLTPVDVNG
jgi:hypothetical protein